MLQPAAALTAAPCPSRRPRHTTHPALLFFPSLPRPQVKCYLRQLFSGLALLEINEVLHRDLKNANLVGGCMSWLACAAAARG